MIYNGSNVSLDVVRDVQPTPEIDAGATASGVTLLLGSLMVLRRPRRKSAGAR